MSYQQRKYTSSNMTTASDTVVIGPIDISGYDKYCVIFQQNTATAALADLLVQASIVASGTAAGVAPEWFNMSTATLPAPSALGITAIVATSAVNNAYHWLRIKAHNTASVTGQRPITITIAGFTR